MMKNLLLAATLVVAPIAAEAATLSLSFTGVGTTRVLSKYDLLPDLDGQRIEFIRGNVKTASNGLSVNGAARVTVTYLGSEAGNTNFSGGGVSFTQASALGSSATFEQLAGLIDFSFGTSYPATSAGVISNNGSAFPVTPDYKIGYKLISNLSAYVLFDDIANGDQDFDDFAVRIDVAAVPLPAGGLLLIGAMGALAALRKRRAA